MTSQTSSRTLGTHCILLSFSLLSFRRFRDDHVLAPHPEQRREPGHLRGLQPGPEETATQTHSLSEKKGSGTLTKLAAAEGTYIYIYSRV
jgi:hypothetical protein